MKFHSQDFFVGEQADQTPVPEQFEAGPFRKSRPPEPLRRFANERGWRFRLASHDGGENVY